MIARSLEKQILQSLKDFPVVGLIGSRQVGKTTLAKKISREMDKDALYLDLELPSDLNKLKEPELFLQQYFDSLVIIDEIQRVPELFPVLRALVDQKRTNSRFLILGSASPDLIKKSSESLAGRIIYHELSPFSLEEIGYDDNDIKNLWLRGGYPESFLAENLQKSYMWREAFIKTYLEMDIPQLGFHIPSMQLRRFWIMLAHLNGQLWNASKIASNLGLSAPTMKRYLDILEETFVVRQLLPYFANIGKRITKSPKVYLRDSGLLHTLLGNKTYEELVSHPSIGASWEGYVIEQICSLHEKSYQMYFYRTSAGAEIDLLLIDKNQKITAVEVKYSLSPQVSKGFWLAFKDLSCSSGYVVYPGKEQYVIKENIRTLPIKDIGKLHLAV